MSDIAIRVEGLSKKYRIGKPERYKTLRDTLTNSMISPIHLFMNLLNGRKSNTNPNSDDTIWALKDVSFEVKKGEVIGIIGRNGAGKSTLLKILSQITEPTEGRVEIHGRVGSLLEVGTGFHPELTGRENIFLYGAILGMKKVEIDKKFDEIVAFAETEKFIDTPIKHYSSGMYMRLAFAVAAHLEPEILLVDEVLAVGDIEFQKKCLGKMRDAGMEERTIIFVSHQLAAVTNLCEYCILLDHGKLLQYGRTDDIITQYLNSINKVDELKDLRLQTAHPSWAKPLINSVRVLGPNDEEQSTFPLGSDIVFEMTFSTMGNTTIKAPVMGVVINHSAFGTVCAVNTRMTGFWPTNGPFVSATMRCKLRNVPFIQGKYYVDIWLGDGPVVVDTLTGCRDFYIEATDIYRTGHPPFAKLGVIFVKPEWEIIPREIDNI
jgi:lipopolysaccharide transport system ATP-binding protein